MAFRDNLKRLRQAKGMSQEALANAIGGGQSRIANYEADPSKNGARSPDVDELPAIANALGVEVQELFGESPRSSQAVGFDAEIVATALTWLRKHLALTGKSEDLLTHPVYLFAALELAAGERAGLSDFDVATRFAARIKEAKEGGGNERGKDDASVPIGGRPRRARN